MVISLRRPTPSRVAIIGAGMAGLACAQELVARGLEVRLFDKGRGAGGRMSTRLVHTPLGEARFDHGAPGFSAYGADFRACVDHWVALGHAALWPAQDPETFVGAPSMNAPLKAMAQGLEIAWSTQVVTLLETPQGWRVQTLDGAGQGPFDAVIVATPAEQATPLLSPHAFDLAVAAARVQSDPIWSAMVVFDAPVPDAAMMFRGEQTLALAARENSKPGRAGPESWTLQATPDWSRRFLASSVQEAGQLMLQAFARHVGAPLPGVVSLQAHRWRYARPVGPLSSPLWKVAPGLGVCGDWLAGDGVEAAWLSGRRLAHRIAPPPYAVGLSHSAAAPLGEPNVKRSGEPTRSAPPIGALASTTRES